MMRFIVKLCVLAKGEWGMEFYDELVGESMMECPCDSQCDGLNCSCNTAS